MAHWPLIHWSLSVLSKFIESDAYAFVRRTRIQRRENRIITRSSRSRNLRSTSCMGKRDRHWRRSRAEADKATLVDIVTALPAPVVAVVRLNFGHSDLVRFSDTLARVGGLNGIIVTKAIAILFG